MPGQTCVAGQAVGGGERRRVTAGGGEELGAEQSSDAGHAQDHRGGVVAVKPVLDELVGVLDLLIEGNHPFRQLRGQMGRQRLAGQGARWA